MMDVMLKRQLAVAVMTGIFIGASFVARAAELILPENRNAYCSAEAIPLAVADLAKDAEARLELLPQKPGAEPVKLLIKGDGSTCTVVLPALSLAPNVYAVNLDGKEVAKLTINTGVMRSSMPVSQTSMPPPKGGANFTLGNAFGFGLIDAQGLPDRNPRGKRSSVINVFESAFETDWPTLIYMYWTGYLTHKPFGSNKSWVSPSMTAALRQLNFSVAQRLRRYDKMILGVGTMDEPLLPLGKSPAGYVASGFPRWDEQAWYESHGWKYRQDVAEQSDAEWMKYAALRGDILREVYQQARNDIKQVWPSSKFIADFWDTHHTMGGNDTITQRVNDVPCSHVFFDFYGGPMSTAGLMYQEKAYDPPVHLAHAMNGQLTESAGPQAPLYDLLMNQMLAAGLYSNWWLNTGTMTDAELAAVNGRAERWGPLFREMSPAAHDVAVLWSFTELAMRQKDMAARESVKRTTEFAKIMVSVPENGEVKEVPVDTNSLEIGGIYLQQVQSVHQALRRAGYPAHIVDERVLPDWLKRYKTLFIIGQTFEFPAEINRLIGEFQKQGGTVVVDPSTKVKIAGAIVCPLAFSPNDILAQSIIAEKKAKETKPLREASRFGTSRDGTGTSNYYDQPVRDAVPAIKDVMAKTKSRPVYVSTDVDLQAERHVGGEGQLLMVQNGHEKYPELPEDKPYPSYNYSPASSTFTLQNIPDGSVVYAVEGSDWGQVTKVADFAKPIDGKFSAGEMKLYIVAPQAPKGFKLTAAADKGMIDVKAAIDGPKMPWPFMLTVKAADGRNIYQIYRSTRVDGTYAESLPLGRNVAAGSLTVQLASPIAGLAAETKIQIVPETVSPQTPPSVQVMDEAVIRKFLASKPELVVVIGNDAQKSQAEELVSQLSARGIKATAKPEAQVLRRNAYPRVWDPYVNIYHPAGDEKKPPAEVKADVTLNVDKDGNLVAKTADGKVTESWRAPGTLVTVAGEIYMDWSGDSETIWEPGCKFYIDAEGTFKILNGEEKEVDTTPEFRAKWSKPWQRLMLHVGGFQLPPALPEAYAADSNLILLGDSTCGETVAALQASEILPQIADAKYPGPGKALVEFAWSPFGMEKNVIFIGASDESGLKAGMAALMKLAP